MYCTKCNKEYDDSYASCPFCGAEAEVAVEAKPKDPNLLPFILSIVSVVLGVLPMLNISGLVCGLLTKLKFKPEAVEVEEGAELDEETAKKVKKIKLINILTLVGIVVSALFLVGNILSIGGSILGAIFAGPAILAFFESLF